MLLIIVAESGTYSLPTFHAKDYQMQNICQHTCSLQTLHVSHSNSEAFIIFNVDYELSQKC